LQDFTLQSEGASFKKWGCLYIHSPKSPSPFSKLLETNFKKIKKIKKRDYQPPIQVLTRGWWATGGRPAADRRSTPEQGADNPFFFLFFFLALHFLCKWSTLAGWLQHMPALASTCPKTSNTHNF
jgi:hypothetical protein